MFKKNSVGLFCVLMLIAVLAVACGGQEQNLADEIMGSWGNKEETGDTMIYTFEKDGNLNVSLDGVPFGLTSSYSWVDSDTIYIYMALESDVDEITADVAIDGDTMTLFYKGQKEVFTRVK